MDLSEQFSHALGSTSDHLRVARESGYLRNDGADCLLNAQDDVEAVQSWLSEYQVHDYSRHTLSAAKREAERFLLWASIELGKPLSGIRREDANAYRLFLADPQPADRWCGPKFRRSDPRWRPFAGPLKGSSIEQALTLLSVMFDYLVEMRYLTANPLGARRRTRSRNNNREHDVTRLIDDVMWDAVMAHVAQWPRDTPAQLEQYERARYILTLMYLLAPRLADLPSHTMGDIERLRMAGGGDGWWWRAKGKGGKIVKLPLSDDAVSAIRRWRLLCGLPAMPQPNETTPLVGRIGNPARSISGNMIYRIVRATMKGAAEELADMDPERAHLLKQASPHWIRHTALSRMAEILPIHIVRDLARHANLKTTNRYVHTGDQTLYEAAQKHRMTWPQ